jgi:hypothetical protein
VNHVQKRVQKKGETVMLASLKLEPIDLEARTVHHIDNARGQEVTCVSGVVWITQSHYARVIILDAIRGLLGSPQIRNAREIILAAGQSVVLDRRGLAVVFAFKDALITVGTPPRLPQPESCKRRPVPTRNAHRSEGKREACALTD